MPHPAPGLRVAPVARQLEHPRWVYVLPNGDILVAESDTPPKPDDAKGIRGAVQKLVQKHAGSGAHPSANRITLLRDVNGDGQRVERHIFMRGLNSPIGMVLVGNTFFVADTDAVVKVPYKTGDTEIQIAPTQFVALPAGPINHHWTKSLIASADGKKLYVGVGSNSNAGENGMDAEKGRNAIWEIDVATGSHRIFADGLRNPVGLAWQPDSGALWVSVRAFDADIIDLCVRWYITYRLSYRDLVEMMAERGIKVAHSTILRWVTRYVPEFEKRNGGATLTHGWNPESGFLQYRR
jgi:glucose/arabinose dehydrogenase